MLRVAHQRRGAYRWALRVGVRFYAPATDPAARPCGGARPAPGPWPPLHGGDVFRATRMLRQSWAKDTLRRWMCPSAACRHVSKGTQLQCERCGTAKPPLRAWKCVRCDAANHSGVKKCKTCGEPHATSAGFWMCAACQEKNRIDELEDNSRCGFCGYDMAPMSRSEEDILQQSQERFQSSPSDASYTGEGAAGAAGPRESESARKPVGLAPPTLKPIAPFEFKAESTKRSFIGRAPPKAVTDRPPPGPPGFDWMCRVADCGCINPGDEEVCISCGVHIAPAEWECPQCAALNHLSRPRCFSCTTPIPLNWSCASCGEVTSIYDKTCRRCHTERPPTVPKLGNDIRREQQKLGGSDWYCTACQAMNFSRRRECFQCGAPRAAQGGRSAPRSTAFVDGPVQEEKRVHNNWTCPHCNSNNFRTRDSCWQCGQRNENPNMRGEQATLSYAKEGFQEGRNERPAEGRMNEAENKNADWVCAKCFARNFKMRQECYKCGAPKTHAFVPRRTTVRKPAKL
ncbi:hypothetical protein STCU_06560 [Strigomonas culicis]|uniref:RanBP2-type domain-containing protein n=1 Tax=Strigomonas culicis TaxID=28005 RepID=S9U9T4_9TRYP|nr:hypothetical protein STCU_06560 [Strigomonas culicis]|eukprot:EPY25683.1 hypothetical protein STCU_06560 [Strigomonas culicis]